MVMTLLLMMMRGAVASMAAHSFRGVARRFDPRLLVGGRCMVYIVISGFSRGSDFVARRCDHADQSAVVTDGDAAE